MEKVTSINSCVSLQVIRPDIVSDELEAERQKSNDKAVRYDSSVSDDRDRNVYSQAETKEDIDLDNIERKMTGRISVDTPRNVPHYDGIGEELRAATTEAKSTVTSFFSKILNNLSNTAGTDDINLAQKNRIKMARKSGRIIRNFGGVLAKSATDTLGFWVGLGFDDEEEEEEGEKEEEKEAELSNRDGVSGERKSTGKVVSTGGRDRWERSSTDHEKKILPVLANSDRLSEKSDDNVSYPENAAATDYSLIDESVTGQICEMGMSEEKISDQNTDIQPIINMGKISSENLEDSIEFKSYLLGDYQEKVLFLCTGENGSYFEWNDRKISYEDKIELNKITIYDAISYIEKDLDTAECSSDDAVRTIESNSLPEKSKTILRVFDENVSLRQSKFGPYIFYKTSTMKKPKFIDMNYFNFDLFQCDKKLILDIIYKK